MEYRDLYDSNRILTGEKIKKGDDIPQGRYYLTVVIFIENSKHEFLLQINKKYNIWTTTGGHPKSGESSLEGIITEIEEELGFSANSKRIKLVKTYQTEDDFVDLYYLKKNISLKKLKLQEEVGNISWFNREQIEQLIKTNQFLPTHIKFYYDTLKYLNQD